MILAWPHSPPCRLFDANNVELKYVTWCETETGEIEELVQAENGKFEIAASGNLLRRKRKVPAPIRVEKCGRF